MQLSDAPLDWCDVALTFDPTTGRGDLALDPDGDLALDFTPATPMLISFGSDRRATPDDELPDGEDVLNTAGRYARRRGWFGDTFSAPGDAIGSRLWLLNREKEAELTRVRAELYLREAFAWAEDAPGGPAEISAAWSARRRQTLELRIRLGMTRLAFLRPLGSA